MTERKSSGAAINENQFIDPSLIPKWIHESALTIDPENVNTHDQRNIEVIVDSLRRFGQRTPIVVQRWNKDGDPIIVKKGNGTLIAFRVLCDVVKLDPEAPARAGWNHTIAEACRTRTIAIVIAPMDGAEADGYAIVDNQSGRLSRFDMAKLGVKIRSLRDAGLDLRFTGFNDVELKPLLIELAAEDDAPAESTPVNTPASAKEKNKLVSFTPAQWLDVETAIEVLTHRGHINDDMSISASVAVVVSQLMEHIPESERDRAKQLIEQDRSGS